MDEKKVRIDDYPQPKLLQWSRPHATQIAAEEALAADEEKSIMIVHDHGARTGGDQAAVTDALAQ